MDEAGFTPDPVWVAADQRAAATRPRRRHRMVFTSRTVRAVLLRDPTGFVEVACDDGSPWFVHLWNMAGQTRSVKELMDPGPMVVTQQSTDRTTMIVVRLPPPAVEPEAYFIGIVARWDDAHKSVTSSRYFALEHGMSPVTAETNAVVCEWALDRHINYRVEIPVDELAFLRAMKELDQAVARGAACLVLPDNDFRNLTNLAKELGNGP